jgi:hypothetical protein
MSERPEPRGAADVAILVVSWDGYADLWDPFFRCLFKAWPGVSRLWK